MVWWQRSKRAVLRGAGAAGLVSCLAGCDAGPAPSPSAGLPEEVGFEIMNPDRPRALRCNPDIRLDRKVSTRTHEELSNRLLETEAADCGFGLATYYLPVMRPGSGAWAIAELGPQISVSMLGLSAEDEAKLIERAAKRSSSVGLWVDDTSYASVISLGRDNIGVELTRFYLDGGSSTEPIRIAKGESGFELRPAAAGGGRHYRLGAEGELETWDGIGFLSAARKIRLDVDLAAIKREDESSRAQRLRAAKASGSRRRAAAQEERWRKFSEWLAVYESSLAPARHPVRSLGVSKDADTRAAACSRLIDIMAALPPLVREAPSKSVDATPLLMSLGDLRDSCASNLEIKVLVDAASATTVWRNLDRSVEQVVSELRPVEE